ncbi:Fic family protein [Methylosinus sp. LW3]|uniref:Fic/DOC family protein n=1 Tax=unclassified Methylosinus TaxID=2624500 RepID=UPI0032AEF034
MYRAVVDPYCYSGTRVLKNRLGLRAQADLDAFEADATAQRFSEPLPTGRFGVRHYRAVHRHIFGDVYRWAGCFLSVRIAKGASMFCYLEHIAAEMARIFDGLRNDGCLRDLPVDLFAARSARFLSELNAVHPFRDGNGRAQRAFFCAPRRSRGAHAEAAQTESGVLPRRHDRKFSRPGGKAHKRDRAAGILIRTPAPLQYNPPVPLPTCLSTSCAAPDCNPPSLPAGE